ncbi:MAG: glycosyltransferase family 87 protein [Chloroflexi bacterium]|nr:glycosyltransferase family 87 protein [Chloroflexota bacterium]
MPASARQRLVLALAFVAASALVVWYANQVFPHVRDLTQGWNQVYLFPMMSPVGADFRPGVYFPGSLLAMGKDPYVGSGLWYPPFSALLFLPYQILDADPAYSAHVLLLVLLTIASVGCSIRIAESALPNSESSRGTTDSGVSIPLFLSLTFLTISSYGFLFNVERGNIDIYPLAFSLAGLWILIRKPRGLWLQVLCFSAAAHLKVYPAVLFLLLLWRHGRKSLVPIVVINAAFLLCLGPGPAQHFIETLSGVAASPGVWVGNHSAASFAQMLNGFIGERGGPAIPSVILYGLPLMIWLATVWVLLRRKYSEFGAVWLFASSVPLMNLIPSTSHDYKLVLLSAPFAMLLVFLLEHYVVSGQRLPLAQIAVACVLLVFLSVSYVMLPSVLGNKYPFIIGTQALLLWSLLTVPSGTEAGLVPDLGG